MNSSEAATERNRNSGVFHLTSPVQRQPLLSSSHAAIQKRNPSASLSLLPTGIIVTNNSNNSTAVSGSSTNKVLPFNTSSTVMEVMSANREIPPTPFVEIDVERSDDRNQQDQQYDKILQPARRRSPPPPLLVGIAGRGRWEDNNNDGQGQRYHKTLRRSVVFLAMVILFFVLIVHRLGRGEIESESAKKATAGSSSKAQTQKKNRGDSSAIVMRSPFRAFLASLMSSGSDWWEESEVPHTQSDEIIDRWADHRRRDVLKLKAKLEVNQEKRNHQHQRRDEDGGSSVKVINSNNNLAAVAGAVIVDEFAHSGQQKQEAHASGVVSLPQPLTNESQYRAALFRNFWLDKGLEEGPDNRNASEEAHQHSNRDSSSSGSWKRDTMATTITIRQEEDLKRYMLQHVRASEPWRQRHWRDYDVYKPIGFGEVSGPTSRNNDGKGREQQDKTAQRGIRTRAKPRRQLPWKKVFIAANLFNNEEMIGDFTASLTAFIERGLLGRRKSLLEPRNEGAEFEDPNDLLHDGDWFKPEDVFVSIYSNANKDSTPYLLEHLVHPQLSAIGIHHHIVPQGAPSCSGLRFGRKEYAAGISTKRFDGEVVLSGGAARGGKEGGTKIITTDEDGKISKRGIGHNAANPDEREEVFRRVNEAYGSSSSSRQTHGMRYYDRSYKKPKEMSRIEWLGCLRNHALLPLLIHGKDGLFGGGDKKRKGEEGEGAEAPSVEGVSAAILKNKIASGSDSSFFKGLSSSRDLHPAFLKWYNGTKNSIDHESESAFDASKVVRSETHRIPIRSVHGHGHNLKPNLLDYDSFIHDWLKDHYSRPESERFRRKWRGRSSGEGEGGKGQSASAEKDEAVAASAAARCNHSFGLTGYFQQPYQNWWDPHSFVFKQNRLRYEQAVVNVGSSSSSSPVCRVKGPLEKDSSVIDNNLFTFASDSQPTPVGKGDERGQKQDAQSSSSRSLLSRSDDTKKSESKSGTRLGSDDDDDDDVLVLFFNDVYFYPWQISYLMATNTPVEQSSRPQSSSGENREKGEGAAPSPTYDMACALDYYNNLYDTWVLRGLDGQPFTPYAPYAPVEGPAVGPLTDLRPILEEQRKRGKLHGETDGRVPPFSVGSSDSSRAATSLTGPSLVSNVLGYNGYYSQLKNAIVAPTTTAATVMKVGDGSTTLRRNEASSIFSAPHAKGDSDHNRLVASSRVDNILKDMTAWIVDGGAGTKTDDNRHDESKGNLTVLPGLPVRSCWNGVVAIRGSLFLNKGLRFRFQTKEELLYQSCWESECKYIGQDMATIAMISAMESETIKSNLNSRDDDVPQGEGLKRENPIPKKGTDLHRTAATNDPFILSPSRVVINPLVQISYEKDFFALYQGEEATAITEPLGELGRRWGSRSVRIQQQDDFENELAKEKLGGQRRASNSARHRDPGAPARTPYPTLDMLRKPSSVFWWARGYSYAPNPTETANREEGSDPENKNSETAIVEEERQSFIFSGDTMDAEKGDFTYTVLSYVPPPSSRIGFAASSQWFANVRAFLSTPIRRLFRHFIPSGLYYSLQHWVKVGAWLPGLALGPNPPNPFFGQGRGNNPAAGDASAVTVSSSVAEVLALILQVSLKLASYDSTLNALRVGVDEDEADKYKPNVLVGLSPLRGQLPIPSELLKFVSTEDPLVVGGDLRPASDAHMAPSIPDEDHALYKELFGASSQSGFIGQWWWHQLETAEKLSRRLVYRPDSKDLLSPLMSRFSASVNGRKTTPSSMDAERRLFFTAVRILLTLKNQHGYDAEQTLEDSLGVNSPRPRELRVLLRSIRGGGQSSLASVLDPRAMFCVDATDTLSADVMFVFILDIIIALVFGSICVLVRRHAREHHAHHFSEVSETPGSPFSPLVFVALRAKENGSPNTQNTSAGGQGSPRVKSGGTFGLAIPATPLTKSPLFTSGQSDRVLERMGPCLAPFAPILVLLHQSWGAGAAAAHELTTTAPSAFCLRPLERLTTEAAITSRADLPTSVTVPAGAKAWKTSIIASIVTTVRSVLRPPKEDNKIV